MDEDRRPFWDLAMWADEDEHEAERRQQEQRELIIRLTCALPPQRFPGPTPTIMPH
ncbi:MAG TPA: hypothetical protein PLZ36_15715 [Armatimonadota bacterium]|nr:hypothetical protein [Armatimonadota bacterium]HOS42220.1 hypothetical protein [Armatimonadota bacterium]